jgi:heme exporter protein A
LKIDQVDVKGVVKTFGRTVVALRSVSLHLEAARLTIIEGPNGSGKSTLLGVLGTVVRPNSGRVDYHPLSARWGSLRDSGGVERVREMIGWVSHETLAYPDLTGRQNIELVARLHGLPVGEAWARAAERFELGSFAFRPARTYSRGQKQRLALARALVHEPSLVLLDEPTAGLDRAGIGRLFRVLDEEIRGRAIVAVVSHEPDVFAANWPGLQRVTMGGGRIAKPE